MSLRIKLCLLVTGLVISLGMLACGPASPIDLTESAGIQNVPQEDPTQEAPTSEPILPTIPTFIPTYTPRPTLPPNPPASATEQAMHDARQAAAAGQSATSLASEVTEFTRYNVGARYEAIVRAKVTAHRIVEPNSTIEWPDRIGNPPYFDKLENEELAAWRRSKLQINETYLGDLPQGYELLAPEFGANQAVDVGKEYIIYIGRYFVAEGEFPDRVALQHYNVEQLSALGGPGGLASLDQTWIIDGDTAWLLPRDHIVSTEYASGLNAGQAAGDSLPLSELVSAIKAGLNP